MSPDIRKRGGRVRYRCSFGSEHDCERSETRIPEAEVGVGRWEGVLVDDEE